MRLDAARIALFCDFDGVLVDIAERPHLVAVDEGLPAILRAVSRRLDGAFAIVSGRRIADLDSFLRSDMLNAAGLHGVEWRLAGEWRSSARADLGAVAETLAERLPEGSRMFVENKGGALALHWRGAQDEGATGLEIMTQLAAQLGPEWRLQLGKSVAELLPADAHKSAAILRFMMEPPFQGRVPVFAGDDLTDEPGFGVVNEMGGLSIHVGSAQTQARIRLPNGAAFRALLAELAQGDVDLPEVSD